MSATNQLSKSFSIGGKNFNESRTISANRLIFGEVSLGAALTGTVSAAMTSTTSTTTTLPPGGTVNGTLNLTSVGNVAIGDYLDVYWSGATPNPLSGACYGGTVEDISGTTVFFTGATLWSVGTAFPSSGTTITCMIPTSYPTSFTGSNCQSLTTYCDQPSCFVWDAATRANTYARVTPIAQGVDHWESPSQVANPVAGANITQIYVSHGYSGGSATLRWAALVNP